jgi:hypothetical protein
MSSSSNTPSDQRCQQRMLNGDPCMCPVRPGKRFCHTHELMGPPPIDINNSATFRATHVYLPQLENAVSIQAAISEVCELLLHRRIEPKEASALFYAMQVASTNIAFLNAAKNPKPVPEPSSVLPSDPKLLPPGTIQACAQPRAAIAAGVRHRSKRSTNSNPPAIVK